MYHFSLHMQGRLSPGVQPEPSSIFMQSHIPTNPCLNQPKPKSIVKSSTPNNPSKRTQRRKQMMPSRAT